MNMCISTKLAEFKHMNIKPNFSELSRLLDFDLAGIYGYSTKAFNQQVKNNTNKFPDIYRFQLRNDELNIILRSKNLTSRCRGQRYLPCVK